MRVFSNGKRVAAVLAGITAVMLINVPTASANFTSSIAKWTDGDTSRHWSDNGTYSQVQFRSCTVQYGTVDSVVVKLLKDRDLWADEDLGSKTYTNCFNGEQSWSNGQWTDVPKGSNTLHFETDKVAQGGSCCLLWVAEVSQDTSEADS